MNNEEKILALLEQLTSDVGGLKTDMSDVRGRLANVESDVSSLKIGMEQMNNRLANVETDVSSLKNNMSEVRLILENKIEPYIERLPKGIRPCSRRWPPLPASRRWKRSS